MSEAKKEIMTLANLRIADSRPLSWIDETEAVLDAVGVCSASGHCYAKPASRVDAADLKNVIDLVGRDYQSRTEIRSRIFSARRMIERLTSELDHMERECRIPLDSHPDRSIRARLNDCTRRAMKVNAQTNGIETEIAAIVWANSHLASLTE